MNQGSHHITASKPQPILRVPSCGFTPPRDLSGHYFLPAAVILCLPSPASLLCSPILWTPTETPESSLPVIQTIDLFPVSIGAVAGAWMPPCCAVLCLVTQSWPTLCDPMNCSPPSSSVHRDSPGKNTGVGRHALLQGIFPIQGLNPPLLHCRQTLYCLSHQRSS